MKEISETYLGNNSVVSTAVLTFSPNVKIKDFDNVLVEYLVSQAGNDVIATKDVLLSALQRLRRVAEHAKKQLSSAYGTEIACLLFYPLMHWEAKIEI
ncbi:hypothetical protein AQUCO_00500195v1 [Aquilegia coerulea]|uniref:Uncharacterized protein n=1 Tax=Aquilegia coerulea TaxID=218851 RepID=A0A2G5EQU1_AQUCA|nr:hypothetical protein AQUCO_00500195v1 [Aquilegia coerulea]